eukprot:1772653-Rhodomonas_salina.1
MHQAGRACACASLRLHVHGTAASESKVASREELTRPHRSQPYRPHHSWSSPFQLFLSLQRQPLLGRFLAPQLLPRPSNPSRPVRVVFLRLVSCCMGPVTHVPDNLFPFSDVLVCRGAYQHCSVLRSSTVPNLPASISSCAFVSCFWCPSILSVSKLLHGVGGGLFPPLRHRA